MKMADLDKAIGLASKAHAGQRDKAGQPYILHPLRLMLRFQEEIERIVAVLHDVVEDSEVTLDDLRELGFSEQVIGAIDCLSRRVGESYDEFLLRVASNELARKIKIEDLKDNLDLTRVAALSDKDLARVAKYHKALIALLNTTGADSSHPGGAKSPTDRPQRRLESPLDRRR